MKPLFLKFLLIISLFSCSNDDNNNASLPYSVSGNVIDAFGVGVSGIQVFYNDTDFVYTSEQGKWSFTNLTGQNTIKAVSEEYTFNPNDIEVNASVTDLIIKSNKILSQNETQIFTWFNKQQLPNGLLESVENGGIVSLYDNALAAMVFMLQGDFSRAEQIFDYFDSQIDTELTNGVGGFSQFRDQNGNPSYHRWMGDNAWLLIALNNYKQRTGLNTYNTLALELTDWLMDLQDADGGLFAGYGADDQLLNYKVTEGNIDAFNAVDGYDTFHSKMLNYLKTNRWRPTTKSLVAWPENPAYLYALDLHPWSYCIFEDFPIQTLITAERFKTTQTAANGQQVTGYCFDEDKDTVWTEGTGQMALALGLAGMNQQKDFYLAELEKVITESNNLSNAKGIPYATNIGTVYGSGPLWNGADTHISISGGAWYLFAKFNFNPFEVQKNKNMPYSDKFWLQ